TCTGTNVCDETGACKKKIGQPCTASGECASGSCADGYCCGEPCAGDCDTCAAQPGTCTVEPKGTVGTACLPGYLCDGTAHVCATRCAADGDCASNYFCSPEGACVAFCTKDSDCGGQ